MKKELPIYKLAITDDGITGVDFIALVDQPAIDFTWHVFETKKMLFKLDDDRHIISGALMVADLPIYRRDAQRGEYYVVFDKATIEKVQRKFMSNGFTKNFNLMHNPESKTQQATLFNSFIIDSTLGIKTPEGYDELTDGSWFGSAHVTDDAIWDKVKSGEFKGFSVEGNFIEMLDGKEKEKDIIQQIKEILSKP